MHFILPKGKNPSIIKEYRQKRKSTPHRIKYDNVQSLPKNIKFTVVNSVKSPSFNDPGHLKEEIFSIPGSQLKCSFSQFD